MSVGRGPDFIGLGAQRTGTSWLYACLYEHPELCLPRKEINFFGSERRWPRGYGWYEGLFAECPADRLAGEFSSTYLPAPEAAQRIAARYPEAKLIASLRNPVDRAHSSYLNDIVAGEIAPDVSFARAAESRDYLGESCYGTQLSRYLERFPRERLLVLVFERTNRDPAAAVRSVYGFLGVDPDFRPSMLDRQVGAGRVPRSQRAERALLRASAAVRGNRRLRPLWWTLKRAGLGDRLRALNTTPGEDRALGPATREQLLSRFDADVTAVERLVGTALPEWRR